MDLPTCLCLPGSQVEKGACEREFQQLRTCWLKVFRSALRRSKQ